MRKIDIHCHTTNRKLEDILPKSATLDTILEEMHKHDIEKTVVLATYFPHRASGISNFRLLHWIRGIPRFNMFASLDFEHYFYQGINELTELAEGNLIKGIKLYTCYQNIDLKSPNFKEIISIAKNHKLLLMFHCGYSYSCMRHYGRITVTESVKPSHLDFLIKNNPEVNIIISHLAQPFTDELIVLAKKYPNVYSDTSGLIDSKFSRHKIPESIEDIKKFLGECGPKRLLFGTDFPVQTHEDSIFFAEEAMKEYSFPDKQDVYYNNARRLIR